MSTARIATLLGAGAVLVGVAMLCDQSVAAYAMRLQLEEREWHRMIRLAGYLPLWLVVGAALALIDSVHGWRGLWSRGGLLVASTTLAGAVAEVLKILVRRERPIPPFASYSFRPWEQDTWSSAGLGWPSSHVAVAFAAMWVLWQLHPRARPVWLLLGCGCAWSRLAFHDHFLSDVVGAALVAYAVVLALSSVSARSR